MEKTKIEVTNMLQSEMKESIEACDANGIEWTLKKDKDGKWWFTMYPNESILCSQTNKHKEVLKLDKNFHVYIHGDRSKIREGADNTGKYIKLYYKEAQ